MFGLLLIIVFCPLLHSAPTVILPTDTDLYSSLTSDPTTVDPLLVVLDSDTTVIPDAPTTIETATVDSSTGTTKIIVIAGSTTADSSDLTEAPTTIEAVTVAQTEAPVDQTTILIIGDSTDASTITVTEAATTVETVTVDETTTEASVDQTTITVISASSTESTVTEAPTTIETATVDETTAEPLEQTTIIIVPSATDEPTVIEASTTVIEGPVTIESTTVDTTIIETSSEVIPDSTTLLSIDSTTPFPCRVVPTTASPCFIPSTTPLPCIPPTATIPPCLTLTTPLPYLPQPPCPTTYSPCNRPAILRLPQCSCTVTDKCAEELSMSTGSCMEQCDEHLQEFGSETEAYMECFEKNPEIIEEVKQCIFNNRDSFCTANSYGYINTASEDSFTGEYNAEPDNIAKTNLYWMQKPKETYTKFQRFYTCTKNCMSKKLYSCGMRNNCAVKMPNKEEFIQKVKGCLKQNYKISLSLLKSCQCLAYQKQVTDLIGQCAVIGNNYFMEHMN